MLILIHTRMSDIEWSKPVLLEAGHGTVRTVKGPMEALGFLTHGTYFTDEAACEAALRDCCAALQHHKSPEEARATFMALLAATSSSSH